MSPREHTFTCTTTQQQARSSLGRVATTRGRTPEAGHNPNLEPNLVWHRYKARVVREQQRGWIAHLRKSDRARAQSALCRLRHHAPLTPPSANTASCETNESSPCTRSGVIGVTSPCEYPGFCVASTCGLPGLAGISYNTAEMV